MPIEFHCTKCERLIRAPDDAGGKRGKCPHCKESVYIPTPPDPTDEIGVAPLDDDLIKSERKLRQESIRYSAALDHEQGEGYDTAEPPAAEGGVPMSRVTSVDIGETVREYLMAMKASDMSTADDAARRLKSRAAQAKAEVQRMLVDQMLPPDMEDIPPPVYKGFLRTLLSRL